MTKAVLEAESEGEARRTTAAVPPTAMERQNLNIRMGNRRMTRLTNAFSKKAAGVRDVYRDAVDAARLLAATA